MYRHARSSSVTGQHDESVQRGRKEARRTDGRSPGQSILDAGQAGRGAGQGGVGSEYHGRAPIALAEVQFAVLFGTAACKQLVAVVIFNFPMAVIPAYPDRPRPELPRLL